MTAALAYTLGNREAYDQAMRERDRYKIGRYPGVPGQPDYPGGSVWRTPEDVAAHIARHGASLPYEPAVYELELPTSWAVDVTPEPGPGGWYDLLHDARILRRVDGAAPSAD